MTRPDDAAFEPSSETLEPVAAGDPIPEAEQFDGRRRPTIGYVADCPLPDPVCDFLSDGWASQALADDRLTEHLAEHRTGKPMVELKDAPSMTGDTLSPATRKAAKAALKEFEATGRITVVEED